MARIEAVQIEGLPELRKALRQLEPQVRREFRASTFKKAAVLVADKSRPMVPVLTGRLARSVRGTTSGDKAVIRSSLPYANVIQWGGSTGKGHRPGVAGSGSVKVKGSKFVVHALDQNRPQVISILADGVAKAASAHGWKVTR